MRGTRPTTAHRHPARSFGTKDVLVILSYAAVLLALTWPLGAHFVSDATLARTGRDALVKLWDNWWYAEHARAGETLYQTTYLFYPTGISLAFHSYNLFSTFVGAALTPLLGAAGAWNFSVWVGLLGNACAAYFLARQDGRTRLAGWLGGLVYGASTFVVRHATGHPDLAYLFPIPLMALAVLRAVEREDWRWAAAAGVLYALSAQSSIYILIMASFTLLALGVGLGLAEARWRRASFWRLALIAGAAALPLLGLRLYPLLAHTDLLGSALEKTRAARQQLDPLQLVVRQGGYPVRALLRQGWASLVEAGKTSGAATYLGFAPLGLAAAALVARRRVERRWLWLGMAALFLMLSMGPVLKFAGTIYPGVSLPASLLRPLLPVAAVRRPDYFFLGLLLPLAMLAAAGFDVAAERLDAHRALALAAVVALVIAVEYWDGPMEMHRTGTEPIFRQLAEEDGDFAIVDLPFGRNHAKYYMYLASLHGRPIVEGLSSRLPPDAYDTIEANPALAAWRERERFDCRTGDVPARRAAYRALFDDGFRYVLLHRQELTEPGWAAFRASFEGVAPAAEGAWGAAYRLDDAAATLCGTP